MGGAVSFVSSSSREGATDCSREKGKSVGEGDLVRKSRSPSRLEPPPKCPRSEGPRDTEIFVPRWHVYNDTRAASTPIDAACFMLGARTPLDDKELRAFKDHLLLEDAWCKSAAHFNSVFEVLRQFKYLIQENPLAKELAAIVKDKDTVTAQKMLADQKVRELTVTVGELQVARGNLSDELGKEKENRRKVVSGWETDKLRWASERRELEDKLERAEAALNKDREDYIAVGQERIRTEGKGRLKGVEVFKSSDLNKTLNYFTSTNV